LKPEANAVEAIKILKIIMAIMENRVEVHENNTKKTQPSVVCYSRTGFFVIWLVPVSSS
jgi:hypothetical protein